MSARSARRFRLTAIFAFAAVLAVGSAWVNMVLKRSSADEKAGVVREDPDYYMDNFRHFTLKLTGEADFELTGKKMTHYPDNDSYLINFPVMESLDERQRPQITYSDWAFIEDVNSKIHMHENVVVIRPPTGDTEAFRMTTEYLLVLPDEDIMRTDREVIAYQGSATMTGIGMESNNATRELFLLSRAKVVYPPANQKK
ncbi:LPS export ABC transporter periplasmic protein LptC [Oxalobacter vibrioformis]|uniref:LPS export ABC transporter periplasmic protein LptC n=1 Tax=Oxalobacter vibrioformis TaxID=933080 RepID=A0A9E9M084_9BURK|nr:LPS export ABC transporter periplasmic protein LptC [Oxalobacter vibrioformis]WAW10855.1 LPS export ABC transporter periplasmic protein LptC [Oxalobacter vibrioformis]